MNREHRGCNNSSVAEWMQRGIRPWESTNYGNSSDWNYEWFFLPYEKQTLAGLVSNSGPVQVFGGAGRTAPLLLQDHPQAPGGCSSSSICWRYFDAQLEDFNSFTHVGSITTWSEFMVEQFKGLIFSILLKNNLLLKPLTGRSALWCLLFIAASLMKHEQRPGFRRCCDVGTGGSDTLSLIKVL